MLRNCSRCMRLLSPQELCKEQSRALKAERKALGLEGVLFRYYECLRCGKADIFVDIHPLEGETAAEFNTRRDELDAVIRRLHGDEADVVLVERHTGFSVWA